MIETAIGDVFALWSILSWWHRYLKLNHGGGDFVGHFFAAATSVTGRSCTTKWSFLSARYWRWYFRSDSVYSLRSAVKVCADLYVLLFVPYSNAMYGHIWAKKGKGFSNPAWHGWGKWGSFSKHAICGWENEGSLRSHVLYGQEKEGSFGSRALYGRKKKESQPGCHIWAEKEMELEQGHARWAEKGRDFQQACYVRPRTWRENEWHAWMMTNHTVTIMWSFISSTRGFDRCMLCVPRNARAKQSIRWARRCCNSMHNFSTRTLEDA